MIALPIHFLTPLVVESLEDRLKEDVLEEVAASAAAQGRLLLHNEIDGKQIASEWHDVASQDVTTIKDLMQTWADKLWYNVCRGSSQRTSALRLLTENPNHERGITGCSRLERVSALDLEEPHV